MRSLAKRVEKLEQRTWAGDSEALERLKWQEQWLADFQAKVASGVYAPSPPVDLDLGNFCDCWAWLGAWRLAGADDGARLAIFKTGRPRRACLPFDLETWKAERLRELERINYEQDTTAG